LAGDHTAKVKFHEHSLEVGITGKIV